MILEIATGGGVVVVALYNTALLNSYPPQNHGTRDNSNFIPCA